MGFKSGYYLTFDKIYLETLKYILNYIDTSEHKLKYNLYIREMSNQSTLAHMTNPRPTNSKN